MFIKNNFSEEKDSKEFSMKKTSLQQGRKFVEKLRCGENFYVNL